MESFKTSENYFWYPETKFHDKLRKNSLSINRNHVKHQNLAKPTIDDYMSEEDGNKWLRDQVNDTQSPTGEDSENTNNSILSVKNKSKKNEVN